MAEHLKGMMDPDDVVMLLIDYRCLVESYDKAQSVLKDGRETMMDKFQ